MRLSTREGDSGYDRWQDIGGASCGARVFLNGVERKQVFIADEEARYVEMPVLNEAGRVQVNPKVPDEIWSERLYGDVSIVLPDSVG